MINVPAQRVVASLAACLAPSMPHAAYKFHFSTFRIHNTIINPESIHVSV